jgi:hypothetical protein
MGNVVPEDKPGRVSLTNKGDVRRWPRFPFVAIVLAADPSSNIAIAARTTDLSLGGCYIDSVNPLPPGTMIKIELVHKGESFHATGRIVYSLPNMGMGISFVEIKKDSREILVRWIEELQIVQSRT